MRNRFISKIWLQSVNKIENLVFGSMVRTRIFKKQTCHNILKVAISKYTKEIRNPMRFSYNSPVKRKYTFQIIRKTLAVFHKRPLRESRISPILSARNFSLLPLYWKTTPSTHNIFLPFFIKAF